MLKEKVRFSGKGFICFFLFVSILESFAQIPITGPGSCGNANGSYFNSGSLNWPISFNTANSNNLCYKIDKNNIPSTVCFEYQLPSDSVYVSFSIRDCNLNSASVNQGTINGCNAATSLGGSVIGISTYNSSCGLIANNASHGFCGGAQAGDIITVCLTLNTGACANDIIICPVLKCFSENCVPPPCSLPIPSVAGTNSICTGESVTLTASGGTSYSWNTGETTTSITVSPVSSTTYTVTATNSCGSSAFSKAVIINPLPAPNIVSQTNVGCTGGATGSVSVTAGGGTPSYTYSWSPGGYTTSTISGLTTGMYNVTITDANGCSSTQSVAITQPASAVNSTIGSTNATCGNSNGTASVTAGGGTPGYSYSWSPGGATNSVVANLSAGVYTVLITDNNGCTTSASVNVNNSSGPTVGISGQTNVLCNGTSSGSATVTATGGTGALTYLWSPGGQTTNTVTGLSAGTYIVTVTDSNNCVQGQNIIITQPLTAVNSGISSQSDVGCYGAATGSVTITASGGTGVLTYLWSPAGQTTATVNGLTAGTYSVTVSDGNGCSQQRIVSITEPLSAINSGISSVTDVSCKGGSTGSVTVTALGGTGTISYTWSTGETTATINSLPVGTYSVTISDDNGCSQQQQVTITEPAISLNAVAAGTSASCGTNNGTVSVTASGGTPVYTYNWNNGNTMAFITGLAAGTYSVMVTDSKGCTQNAFAIVNSLPGPSITSTSSSNITCNGLTDGTATVNVSNGTLPYAYIWSPNITTSNTAINLPANSYTVVVSDSTGCKDTAVIIITEPLPMTFTLSASNAMVCAGESLTLLSTIPSGGTPPYTFDWLPNGPLVNPLVSTTYSVTVRDSLGCVSTMDTIRVIVLPTPVAGFDTISSGMFGQNYSFTDLSTDGNVWYWEFGDGAVSGQQNPIHVYPGAGTYTVTQVVTSAAGCKDTITLIVVVRKDILIPNIFTPNGDGINDEFWIPSSGFEDFELEIYNRWGIKLYHSNKGEIRWDGRTSAGETAPDGTYYFILNAVLRTNDEGEKYQTKGFIDLHR